MLLKKILLIRLRLLGDIVFTIPAVELLRNRYPKAEISYMVEEEFEEIGKLIPNINELIVIPRKMGLFEMIKLGRKLKKTGFDVLIDLHSGPKSSQIAFLSGVRKKIGYRVPFRSWIYDIKFDRTQKKPFIHSVVNQIRLLKGVDIEISKDKIPQYPRIEINSFKNIFEFLKIKQKIIIHIGAGNEFRDWGLQNYIQLVKKFDDGGMSVFLIGKGKKEEERGKQIADKTGVYNLVSKLDIEETLFLIQNSKLYIGVDSGPLHLASLSNTPIIALYGPNVPEISGPWRKDKVIILQKKMPCRPCEQRVCIYQGEEALKCMKEIDVADVFKSALKFL